MSHTHRSSVLYIYISDRTTRLLGLKYYRVDRVFSRYFVFGFSAPPRDRFSSSSISRGGTLLYYILLYVRCIIYDMYIQQWYLNTCIRARDEGMTRNAILLQCDFIIISVSRECHSSLSVFIYLHPETVT